MSVCDTKRSNESVGPSVLQFEVAGYERNQLTPTEEETTHRGERRDEDGESADGRPTNLEDHGWRTDL